MRYDIPSAWDGHTRPQTHSLPLRMMLRELQCLRSERAFLDAILKSFYPCDAEGRPLDSSLSLDPDTLRALLENQLGAQQKAYEDLEETKEKLLADAHAGVEQTSRLAGLEKACADADKPLKRMLHHLRGNALTFSGGGIRSASFCLGVLQGLSRFSLNDTATNPTVGATAPLSLLHDTQFLSTVSGGGYLGCWFSSWTARLAIQSANGQEPTPAHFQGAYATTLEGLAGKLPATGADPSPQPVRHLREFTSYLAPQLGLSLDVWDLIAIFLRNLLVNWLMLSPLLLILVTVPAFFIFLLRDMQNVVSANSAGYLTFLFFLIWIGAAFSGRALPSYRPWAGTPAAPQTQSVGAGGVAWRFIMPMLVVCFVLSAHFYPSVAPALPSALDAACLSVIATVGFGTLGIFKWWTHYATLPDGRLQDKPPMPHWRAAGLMVVVIILLGAMTGIGLEMVGTRLMPMIANLHFQFVHCDVEPVNYVVFSFPAFLAVLLLGSTLFSALTQELESEEDREWWSRAGGFLMLCGFIWMFSTALVLYGNAWPLSTRFMPPVSGGLIGLLTSLIARSSKTKAGARPETSASSSSRLGGFILPAMSVLSLTLLAIGISRASNFVRKSNFIQQQVAPDILKAHPEIAIVLSLAVFASLAAVINAVININVFSLHGLYRERLMRAFLGASNAARHTDKFIDFDSSDTLLMKQLAHSPGVPLHIVNTTLNLVGTRRAAWRQRKAEAFSFSAISAGAWRLNYVDTDTYGGGNGVTVATAMAISGAAANPNMGYHSSPLVTILMTLFNVRLGWWLPNPKFPLDHHFRKARRTGFLKQAAPLFSVVPLLAELFGLTDDTRRYIELSDGGHFEDLGLYEMVLRRCRYIVVVDSGSDPTFTYEDLGNALRKIEIDLGIPIKFPLKPSMHAGKEAMSSTHNRYCAVANILYSCVDSSAFTGHSDADTTYKTPNVEGSAPMDGKLIYIKACLRGDEPMGVIEYSRTHPTFPHESTGNQFFNEAQFESYRSLGSHVVDSIGGNNAGTDWEHWVAAATQHVTPVE